jgi:hypothetical protein
LNTMLMSYFYLSLVLSILTTKAYSPQTNGICERFNKTMKQEFFEVAMRKKIYNSVDELQQDLDTWLHYYNHERPHSGKFCYGKTPIQTFIDSKKLGDFPSICVNSFIGR